MSSATEYQPVPTTTQSKSRRCRPSSGGIFAIVALCAAFGIALIVFGVLEYKKIDYLSTKPSSCRVNAVGTERKTEIRLSHVYPVWNVDIVKQSQSNNAEKNLVVLRSSLKIKGPGDYKFPAEALEDAQRLYSVGKIYPCYVHKSLLGDAANNNEEINLKHAAQWKKPSTVIPIIWLSVGSTLVAIGIIILIIGILLYYRQSLV